MNFLSRILLAIGTILLVVQISLRIAAPEMIVNQPHSFMFSMSWASMLFLSLAEWKGLSVGSTSAGKPIVISSALLTALATDLTLGLGLFSKSEPSQFSVLFLFFLTAIMLYAWWKILFKGERK